MNRPLLQVALDHLDLPSALASAELLADHVDVLEVGTILCYAEGARAVKAVRDAYPKHVVVADLKGADAGAVLAEMVFSRGATWMTIICCAPYATMETALKTARGYGGDIQVELYGDWSFEQARQWLELGLTQAIYHRGRDAQAAGKGWDREDLAKIRRLADMGFAVSVTGGLDPGTVAQFRGIPVKCFISGRSLYAAKDPAAAAKEFLQAIGSSWGPEGD
jgi:3-dehydro-L-gulonate-6-phosphate decarboxylase